ncbi:hypothetical protein Pelo_17925 [Pelomyxa schiedti]|nr:hypothetical protein Pelo_17925 [Pelomyxa schiedti]
MDFTSCRAVYLGVKAPQSDVPAPHHVLWARDQFVALCAGGIVGRCGSRSPLRVLPPEVLCHEIGRNWIMGSRCRGRVALSSDTKVTKLLWEDTQTTTWFVTVSHTLGVISIDSVGMTGRSRERARWWADRAHVIVSKWNKGLICDCEDGRVVAKLQLVTEQETKWVCSDSWGVVYHPGCYTVEMWPRGGLENSANVLNETCVRNVETPAARSEEVMWMDLLAGNQGVVSIYKEGQWKRFLLWFVDLDKSYQLGVLSVTAAFTLDSVCKGVYWSEKRGFMATQKYKLEGNFGSTYQLVALKTRLSHSNLDDTLRVFSTDDFDTPRGHISTV